MREIIDFDNPVRAIVHFKSNEAMAHTPFFQVVIDNSKVSPSGDFIRFTQNQGEEAIDISEIHGWQLVEEIIIDEVLEEFVEGEFKEIVNG